jgi:hypothetical protein
LRKEKESTHEKEIVRSAGCPEGAPGRQELGSWKLQFQSRPDPQDRRAELQDGPDGLLLPAFRGVFVTRVSSAEESSVIFVKGDIEHPAQRVLDASLAAYRQPTHSRYL